MNHLHFVDKYGSFTMDKPENVSYLYFPLASETGLKSSLTPNLGGDAKIDQETFLLEPVSAENLHSNRGVRNFWLVDEDGQAFSVSGASARQEADRFTPAQDDSRLTAGLMWQTVGAHRPGPGPRYRSDRLLSPAGQCGNPLHHGAQPAGTAPLAHPHRSRSPLRPQRRQHPGPPECDFDAPPDLDHRKRRHGPAHHVL